MATVLNWESGADNVENALTVEENYHDDTDLSVTLSIRKQGATMPTTGGGADTTLPPPPVP